MKRPLVLAVTSEPPWPLNSGGHIRSFHLLKALTESTNLRLVCPVQVHQFGELHNLSLLAEAGGQIEKRLCRKLVGRQKTIGKRHPPQEREGLDRIPADQARFHCVMPYLVDGAGRK